MFFPEFIFSMTQMPLSKVLDKKESPKYLQTHGKTSPTLRGRITPSGACMKVTAITLCNLFATLFILSGIASSIAFRMFWSRLRSQHLATWEQLGRPTSFFIGPLKFRRFIWFLWRRDYESLLDQKTVTFGRFLRKLFVCSMILGALACAFMIFVAWTYGL